MSENSVAVKGRSSTGFATTRTPKNSSRNTIGTAITERIARAGSSCLTIAGSREASSISSARSVWATLPTIPSPIGNSSDFSTSAMNFARVVRLSFTAAVKGRCGGKSPSTATPRKVPRPVFWKRHPLKAPAERIEACTILWFNSWRVTPSLKAEAMWCMKSITRWRSARACWRSAWLR